MSKGINMFNHFNPPKSNGHKITIDFDSGIVSVYCPSLGDNTSAVHTSNGVKCNYCNKITH